MKIYFPLLCIALLFTACKYENCEDIKEGEVALSPSTKSFVPYTQGESVILVNEAGETLELINEVDTTPSSICTKRICKFLRDPYSGSNCHYIEAESIRNVLRSSERGFLVEILSTFEQYEEESDRSYEMVRVTFNGSGFTIGLEHFITAVNFNDTDFDQNKTSLEEFLEEEASVELLGQTFNNVLVTNAGGNRVYLQEGKGLIALKINGDFWRVQD